MSFRNRCQVAGAEGIINLSVPLEKGRDQKALVKDVRIAGKEDWQDQHWKTLVSCYNRSPWFEFYRDELEVLYRTPFTFLVDWNLACFQWTLDVLKMDIAYTLSEEYRKEYDGANWTDWRGVLRPKNRMTPGARPGSATARNQEKLSDPDRRSSEDHGPDPGVLDVFPNVPTGNIQYRQVFEERIGFQPDLSILDLIFCEGKNARTLLG